MRDRWGLFAPWTYLPGMSLRHGFSDNAAVYTIVVLKYVFHVPCPASRLTTLSSVPHRQ